MINTRGNEGAIFSSTPCDKFPCFIAICDYNSGNMRIISRKRLIGFWESRKGDSALAQRSLLAWEKITKACQWSTWADLKQTFGTADRVGNCTVFDVANNNFRLIARINFRRGIVYILKIMDHAEYDASRWEEKCGCHLPPPKRKEE